MSEKDRNIPWSPMVPVGPASILSITMLGVMARVDKTEWTGIGLVFIEVSVRRGLSSAINKRLHEQALRTKPYEQP
ncbi:MAG: hypothetical protein OEZ48_01760 [Candidatus Bathyarchaeota archaeon]|nr:hypothetical protein [Candidatus Bathyarchaeota archaeon]